MPLIRILYNHITWHIISDQKKTARQLGIYDFNHTKSLHQMNDQILVNCERGDGVATIL